MKENGRSSDGRLAAAFLFFGVTAMISVLLFLAALTVWVSLLTESVIVAALLLGAIFALFAAALYLLVIRDAVRRIRARAETVYEVARIARDGYDWIARKALTLLHLCGSPPDTPRRET